MASPSSVIRLEQKSNISGKPVALFLSAGGGLGQLVVFVLPAAMGHPRRPPHPLADLEGLCQLAESAFFLLQDPPLDGGGAPPAIFLRPVQTGPAGFGLLF